MEKLNQTQQDRAYHRMDTRSEELRKLVKYKLLSGRKVTVIFSSVSNETKVTETFEAEKTNSIEMQRSGWQAILDNFKKYTEAH